MSTPDQYAARNQHAVRLARAIELASVSTIGQGRRAYRRQALRCDVRDDGFVGTRIFVDGADGVSREVLTVHASGRVARHGRYPQLAVDAVLEVA
jgi:hypothetical protein